MALQDQFQNNDDRQGRSGQGQRVNLVSADTLKAGFTMQQPNRTGSRSKMAIGVVMALLIATGAWFAFHTKAKPATGAAEPEIAKSEDQNKQTAQHVTVVAAAITPVTNIISVTGTLSARNEMPVGAEGEGGRIMQVNADIGQHVVRGQILARLNRDVMTQQVSQMEANHREAIANANAAVADYQRGKSVADGGFMTKQELEKRLATAESAKAKVSFTAAQSKEMHTRFNHMEIRAPADGVVLARSAEVGQLALAGGEPLFRLSRGGAVELRGQVAEQDLPALELNQPAEVTLTGIDHPFAGHIWQLGAIIDPKSRLGSVRIALAADRQLRPGAFAHATIKAATSNRIVLPQAAVQNDGVTSFVLLVGPDNKLIKRPVVLATTTGAGMVISSGLNSGERVVSTAGAFLHAGDKIVPELRKAN